MYYSNLDPYKANRTCSQWGDRKMTPDSDRHVLGTRSILGLYRDNGKENGNYYSRLGLYRDNGK